MNIDPNKSALVTRQKVLRISILSTYYWPEQTGSSQVMTELAEFLASRGHHITVVTAMPFYPQWAIWPEYRGRMYGKEERQKVTVLRSWHFVRPKPSTKTRALHEFSLAFFAIPNVIRSLFRADHAIVLVPSLGYAWVASAFAKLFGVPRSVVVHDVMPDTAIDLGMLRNPMVIAASRGVARGIYRLATRIETLGEGMKRRIETTLPNTREVEIVPVTVDAAELAPVPKEKNEFARTFGIAGNFTVVHTGNIGQKQDLDILLDAAVQLKDQPNVTFHVFGDGALKDQFLARKAALGVENVQHHALQPRPFLPHMLSGADIVLVSQKPEVVDIVIPSKLMTAMAAGAMIVAACDAASETATLLKESDAGIVIRPGDSKALVDAILAIRAGRVDVNNFRARARAAAIVRFGRDSVYGALESRLQGISEPA